MQIMSHFYHLVNCNRALKAGTLVFHFVPYEHTGCWCGVYEAVDPAEIAALDELAKNPKSSVTTITQEEYNNCIKKKRAASHSYSSSLASSTPTPSESQAALSVGESVEANPSMEPVEVAAPVGSVNEAVEVVKVEPKKKK